MDRSSILAVSDLPTAPVECPEWGGTVHVRTMSAAERDQFENGLLVKKGKSKEANLANIRAKLVVATACDEAGNPLFTPEDAVYVGNKSSKVIDRLFAKAQELCGMSDKDVEEMAKN